MNRAQRARIYRYIRYLSLAFFFSLFVFGLSLGLGTVCSTAIFGYSYSCPFGVFQQTLTARLVTLGLVVSALLIVVLTLFLGRFFCGWICPLGAALTPIGGLLSRIKKQAGLPGFLKNKDIKYGVLLGSVVAAGILAFPVWCIFCPVGGISKIFTPIGVAGTNFTIAAVTPPTTPTIFTPTSVLPVIGTSVILLAIVLEVGERRAWCRYLCPLGATFGLLAGLSHKIGWQIRMPMDRTIECGLCVRNCPMGIPILDQTRAKIKADTETEALAKQKGLTKEELLIKARKEPMPELKKIAKKYSIQSTECIKCFTCVSVCPVYKTEK